MIIGKNKINKNSVLTSVTARLVLSLIMLSFVLKSFSQQTIQGSIMHDGLIRVYQLYVPAIYSGNTSVPLLLNFHGYTSNATEQMFYGDFRGIADTANFIVVHPQGTLDNTGTTHFNVGWGTSTVDDVGFSEALIDSLSAMYNIDQSRIYSTGMSNGGFMSFYLACNLSNKIAAVGSVTGSMSLNLISNCNSIHSIPIIQIHGTNDPTVPYQGSAGWSAPIPTVLTHWVNFNNCNSLPNTVSMPDIQPLDGSTVEKIVYSDGNNCTQVVQYKVTNGAHTWPGSAINLAGTNYDFNASKKIWEFLSEYDINGLINCSTNNSQQLENSIISIEPNPCENILKISGYNFNNQNYEIYSLLGECMLSESFSNNDNLIDVSKLNSSIYILKVGSSSIRFIKL